MSYNPSQENIKNYSTYVKIKNGMTSFMIHYKIRIYIIMSLKMNYL